jgi:probable HAF family extracellular repeat protein
MLECNAVWNVSQTAESRETHRQRTMKLRQLAAVCIGLVLSTAHFTHVSGASFMVLGALLGTAFHSEATGVSADGSVVVGMSAAVSGNEAFRWTAAAGIVFQKGSVTNDNDCGLSPTPFRPSVALVFRVGWMGLLCDVLQPIGEIMTGGRGRERPVILAVEFYGFFNDLT